MVISFISIALFFLGLLLLLGGVFRLRREPWRAGMRTCCGTGLAACAGLIWLVSLNLHTYQRLTAEQPVAQLHFKQLQPQVYEVRVSTEAGRVNHFILRGDEWQLDARILKWKGVALLAGMETRYRLERLSGRYRDVNEELTQARTVVDLAPASWLERWDLEAWTVDLWDLAETHPRWLPMVDAVYGSATYLPMADGVQYQVSVTSSGLIARPLQPML